MGPESAAHAPRIRLCLLDELEDPGTRAFTVPVAGGVLELFVVHKDRRVHGYLNRCPHKGVPLNWQPDEFLDPAGETIVCATHGARFRPSDGACLGGPCRGRPLEPVALQVDEGVVYLATGAG